MDWKRLDDEATDGRSWLLWCPSDTPQIVVGHFLACQAWEGWIFDDGALADIQPEGPEPTHYAPLPPPPEDEAR